jgi:hypothetical protein
LKKLTSPSMGTAYTCATQCTPGTYTMGGETATIKCCNTNKCNTAQTFFRLFGSLHLQLTSFVVLIFIYTLYY